MAAPDYYKLLGLPRNASEEDIKKTYRKLARKHHPDLNPGNKEAEARFKEVSEANDVLSDPEKRRNYDQFGDPNGPGAQMGGQGFEFGGFNFGGWLAASRISSRASAAALPVPPGGPQARRGPPALWCASASGTPSWAPGCP